MFSAVTEDGIGPTRLVRQGVCYCGVYIVESAVTSWDLPDRVKRLSLPTYRYDSQDLEHIELILAEHGSGRMVGVAALESTGEGDSLPGSRSLMLHGLYVDATLHGKGIGRRLVEAAEHAAAESGWDGLLVKAHPSAIGFYETLGFKRLPVRDPGRDYPHRLWRPCGAVRR